MVRLPSLIVSRRLGGVVIQHVVDIDGSGSDCVCIGRVAPFWVLVLFLTGKTDNDDLGEREAGEVAEECELGEWSRTLNVNGRSYTSDCLATLDAALSRISAALRQGRTYRRKDHPPKLRSRHDTPRHPSGSQHILL